MPPERLRLGQSLTKAASLQPLDAWLAANSGCAVVFCRCNVQGSYFGPEAIIAPRRGGRLWVADGSGTVQ